MKENFLYSLDENLLSTLLRDCSSGKNIIWATSDYEKYGKSYSAQSEISPELITGKNGDIIKPRAEKSKDELLQRIRNKAEVFTPAWICNAQNNLVDNAWFGRENVFNTENPNGWKTTSGKIKFSNTKGKSWQDYVCATRLEIACGEAPYLTSRYDAVSGVYIEPKDRVGLLDRKLRIISENVDKKLDWIDWAFAAVKNIYGFDWQGDNVFLSRENILFAVTEYYEEVFGENLAQKYLYDFAEIISWNIWQMDGLKYVIPESCSQQDLCRGCLKNEPFSHNGIYCQIMDWEKEMPILFVSMLESKE